MRESGFDRTINREGITELKQMHMPAELKLGQSDRIKAPVFVIGAPRSGTTALGRCLSAHSRLNGNEESLFLLHLARIYTDLFKGDNTFNDRPLGEYINELDLLIATRDFADRVFGALLDQKDTAESIIDHTPWYACIAPFIRSLYPDARFIHLVRDGRSVVSSLERAHEQGYKWVGGNMAQRAGLWCRLVADGDQVQQLLPDQCHTVYYEDLTSSPQTTVGNLTKFLGLDFEPATLEPLRVNHSEGTTPKTVDIDSGDRPRTAVNWPAAWTKTDITIFNEVAGATMNIHYGSY